ncbi:MAG: hypothetical protein AB3N24_16415 [Leisingera sp.]
MAHIELDLRERRMIEDMLNAKVPVNEMARPCAPRIDVFSVIEAEQFLRSLPAKM